MSLLPRSRREPSRPNDVKTLSLGASHLVVRVSIHPWFNFASQWVTSNIFHAWLKETVKRSQHSRVSRSSTLRVIQGSTLTIVDPASLLTSKVSAIALSGRVGISHA